jgi:hypothetical protein
MNRKTAIAEAHRFADAVVREARGIINNAIEYRRTEPHRFALFHGRMALYWELLPGRRRRVRIAWHRRWEAHYAAKAWALDQDLARSCSIAGGEKAA